MCTLDYAKYDHPVTSQFNSRGSEEASPNKVPDHELRTHSEGTTYVRFAHELRTHPEGTTNVRSAHELRTLFEFNNWFEQMVPWGKLSLYTKHEG